DRCMHDREGRARRAHSRETALARPEQEEQDNHRRPGDERPRAGNAAPPPEATSPFPREEDRLVLRTSSRHDYPAKFDIWMSGMRIEIAMKPTAPPITTIISGSRRLVSICTRVSTSES